MAQSRLVRPSGPGAVPGPPGVDGPRTAVHGVRQAGRAGEPTRHRRPDHPVVPTAAGPWADRALHDALLPSDPAAADRYRLGAPVSARFRPAAAVCASGGCRDPAPEGAQLSRGALRPAAAGALALRRLGMSRADPDPHEAGLPLGRHRRVDPRALPGPLAAGRAPLPTLQGAGRRWGPRRPVPG